MHSTKAVTAFAAPRSKFFARSQAIVDALNEFGLSGGFDKILEMLNSAAVGRTHLSLTHLVALCTFLCKTQPMWHKQFACKYIEQVTEALLKALCYINKEVTDSNKNQLILGPCQEDTF